jgi:hypothetical protein
MNAAEVSESHEPQITAGVRRVGCKHRLAQELIVVRVTADPKPEYSIRNLNTQGTIVTPYPNREITSYTLEMQRGMKRILLEQREVLVSQFADHRRQGMVTGPEGG